MNAEEIIRLLDLVPHPEGGHYREVFRDGGGSGGRSHSTAIYFLLQAGEVSHWHRVDAAELWHWYGGAPLALSIAANAAPQEWILGGDLLKGERPQIVVPPNAWQSAKSLGAYTLCGCTVAPGFEFSTFELASKGFVPS